MTPIQLKMNMKQISESTNGRRETKVEAAEIQLDTEDQGFVTKTVCVGEDVILTCSRQSGLGGVLFWMRVVAGNFPEILGAIYTFDSAIVDKTPRITTKEEPGIFVLHITQTELSDAALYYCQQVIELKTTFLNKTLLRVNGK